MLTIYLISYFLLLIASLVIFRIFVRRDYLRTGRLSIFTSFLQALIFFVFGGFPYIYLSDDWPVVHIDIFLHVIGLILIVVGLGVLLFGMVKLGVFRSLGRGAKKLTQSGLYRISRNPQALACGLYVLGFAILWPSWYALGWVLLFFALIHVMVLTEEEYLLKMYGKEYEEYCNRVPRYF